MTRPPLYVRRPFLAGLLRQLPLLGVLVVVGVMMLTGQFTRLATFFFNVMPEWLKV